MRASTHIFFDYITYPSNTDSLMSPSYGRRQIYSLRDTCEYKGKVYQLYYLNRLGGIDWIIMGGNNIKSSSISPSQYKTNWRVGGSDNIEGNLSKQVNRRYNIASTYSYLLNSDIIEEDQYNALEELISSPSLWLYDAQTGDTIAVEVADTNFGYKQRRFDKMFNFQINVRKQLINNRIQL